ncbi:hypothetical protein [Neobacillus mesonae]|uniref:hypothetical protein n=1 Tax=Neobacillus mesonae TaxID=1193713 RepID=UPI0025723CB2|nr:hypothetical protein [Neobacillus mesonae]
MSIAVICFVTWLVIIVFAIMPKGLTLVEMIFTYFVSSILTVIIFSILDVNLHWVPASKDVEKGVALNICRFVEIPLLLIIGASILNSRLRPITRWLLAAAIYLFFMINERLLLSLGIIVYHNWNMFFASINYILFIIVLAQITRWFIHLERGVIKKA